MFKRQQKWPSFKTITKLECTTMYTKIYNYTQKETKKLVGDMFLIFFSKSVCSYSGDNDIGYKLQYIEIIFTISLNKAIY